MFGYPISLNFNRHSSSFTTFSGGSLSLMINLLLVAFCTVKLIKMFTFDGDSISSDLEPIDFDSLGEITLKEA